MLTGALGLGCEASKQLANRDLRDPPESSSSVVVAITQGLDEWSPRSFLLSEYASLITMFVAAYVRGRI